VYPGFSSIFISSRVVGEVCRREGWTLDFPVFILSRVVGEVQEDRKVDPGFSSIFYPFSGYG
jgi:hypothetical protein